MRFVKPVLALWHLNRHVFQTGLAELLIHTGMNGERAEYLYLVFLPFVLYQIIMTKMMVMLEACDRLRNNRQQDSHYFEK